MLLSGIFQNSINCKIWWHFSVCKRPYYNQVAKLCLHATLNACYHVQLCNRLTRLLPRV